MQRSLEKISLAEDFEVRSWARRFGVTADQLRAAVDRVGYDSGAIRKDLRMRGRRHAEAASFLPSGVHSLDSPAGQGQAASPLMPDPDRFADRQAHAQSMDF